MRIHFKLKIDSKRILQALAELNCEYFNKYLVMQNEFCRNYVESSTPCAGVQRRPSVNFDDFRIPDIFEDMVSSIHLGVSSRATSVGYITVSMIIVEKESLLSLLLNLSDNAVDVQTLSFKYLDDRDIYFSFEKGLFSLLRPLMHFPRTAISLHSSTKFFFTTTQELSVIILSFVTWRKERRGSRPVQCSITQTIIGTNYYRTGLRI